MRLFRMVRSRMGWGGCGLSLFCMTGVVGMVALAPVRPVYAQGDNEKATQSQLTGIPLKDAVRFTGGSDREQLRSKLVDMVKEAGGKAGTDEVLVWTKPAYTGLSSAGGLMGGVAEQMKVAGYAYKIQEAKTEGGEGVAIAIGKKGDETVLGYWLKTEALLALVWCRVEKADEAKPAPADTTPSVAPASGTAAATPDTSAVLVAGDPALTRQMVDHTCEFLAYLLETPLTVEQKAKVEVALTDDWKKKDKDTIDFVNTFVDYRAQIFPKPDAERDLIRKKLQPEVLKALRENKTDAGAKWILAIYESAHKPLVAGNPPLTRQMTDAYSEVLYFMSSEVIGEKMTPTASLKDAVAKTLAAGYPKAPAAAKKALNEMPLRWAAMRVLWPRLSDKEKEGYRTQWAKELQTMLPPAKPPVKTASRTTSKSSASSSSSKSKGSSQDILKRMQAMQMMNQAFQRQSQIMMEGHYSRMNMIANLGSSPYRYVNSYGNPY